MLYKGCGNKFVYLQIVSYYLIVYRCASTPFNCEKIVFHIYIAYCCSELKVRIPLYVQCVLNLIFNERFISFRNILPSTLLMKLRELLNLWLHSSPKQLRQILFHLLVRFGSLQTKFPKSII